MPFVDVRMSCAVTAEQESRLKAGLGEVISLIPGKSESSLMVQIAPECHMWFGGSEAGPIVMAKVSIYGRAPEGSFEKFGEAAVALFRQVLGAEHVYVKLDETTDWAW
ncbi:hypothetical protein [Neglectibacter caecimuris]|uniref:hypothetical protein n=1 Tax=Neglectibacter caecimuris TaxID=3093658 RepID=UPI002AC96927|nr:hypothetical protein [Neglectibacter sp. M00184]